MAPFQVAQTLITKHFSQTNWHSQPPTDWTGPFPLPKTLIDYYDILGPVDVILEGYGNPCFLPRLAQLWSYQAGYRYNSITGELLGNWNDDWIVVADEGANPFILSRTTGQVSFALIDSTWQPSLLFDNLEEMVTCLLVLGGVRHNVTLLDFTDADSFIKPHYYFEALHQLSEVLSSPSKAGNVLSQLSWGTNQNNSPSPT